MPNAAATVQPQRLPLPRFLQIEPIGQCNLRCKMCVLHVSTPDRGSLGNMARQGTGVVWNGEAYRDSRNQLASAMPPSQCRPRCAGAVRYHGTF
jgi:hypothetical protein